MVNAEPDSGTVDILRPSVTPASIWNFVGLKEEVLTGKMFTPEDEDTDDERLKDDVVMARSLFEDFIHDATSIGDALCLVAQALFDEEDRGEDKVVAILAVHDSFTTVGKADEESIDVHAACQALAIGLQSTFEFDDGAEYAIFDFSDFLMLVDTATGMHKNLHPVRKMEMYLRLGSLSPEVRIPIDEFLKGGEDGSVARVSQGVLSTLLHMGKRLMKYVL